MTFTVGGADEVGVPTSAPPAAASQAEGADDHRPRREVIAVGGGDDAVVRLQLAARWAEAFAPADGDSLPEILRRFRSAYNYIEAVHHGLEPPAMDEYAAG